MAINLEKVVVLIRGVSGSSKSTFAEYVKNIFNRNEYGYECVVVTADDYFTDNLGNYNFDASKLHLAHKQCQNYFEEALRGNVELVICANTNIKPSHFDFYIEKAKEYGYTLFSIVMEKRFEGGDNGHKVPEKSLQLMENNIKISLKLR